MISANDLKEMSQEEWFALASDKNTQPEILLFLAINARYKVLTVVAQNPSTPPEALATMAESFSTIVRRSIAKNPNALPGTLLQLADDTYDQVPYFVAQNPSTPPEVLLKLSTSATSGTREGVARNPNTSHQGLERLAKDSVTSVRHAVLENPSVLPSILHDLIHQDSDLGVVMHAIRNPKSDGTVCDQKILQTTYEKMLEKNILEEDYIVQLLQHNLQLEQTEVCALVAFFGEKVAKEVSQSGQVNKNSILDRQLLQLGIFSIYQSTKSQDGDGYHA